MKKIIVLLITITGFCYLKGQNSECMKSFVQEYNEYKKECYNDSTFYEYSNIKYSKDEAYKRKDDLNKIYVDKVAVLKKGVKYHIGTWRHKEFDIYEFLEYLEKKYNN